MVVWEPKLFPGSKLLVSKAGDMRGERVHDQAELMRGSTCSTTATAVTAPRAIVFALTVTLAIAMATVAPRRALAQGDEPIANEEEIVVDVANTPSENEEDNVEVTSGKEKNIVDVASNDDEATTPSNEGEGNGEEVVNTGEAVVTNPDAEGTSGADEAVVEVTETETGGDEGKVGATVSDSDDEESAADEAADKSASETTPVEEETTDPVTTPAAPATTPKEAASLSTQTDARQGHFDNTSGKLRFIWDDDGSSATSELVGPDNGAEYWAWATADGTILCGKWDNGAGLVYVADSNGRLIGNDLTGDESGWVYTNAYDVGKSHRYWVDIATRAAVTGFINVSGYGKVFGLSGKGYLLQGTLNQDGYVILAAKSGKFPTKTGWLVTDKYGQGTQRYWVEVIYTDSNGVKYLGAKPGFSNAGYAHYTTDKGYVLCDVKKQGKYVILADKNGKLPTKAGWLVTSKYGQGKQRYYVETIAKDSKGTRYYGTKPGFSKGGYKHYTTDEGYVLRGTMKQGKYVILADKNGKLPTKSGWLITDKYGQGERRYWIQKIYKSYLGTKIGYSKAGYKHYTNASGYVVCNKNVSVGGTMYKANKYGLLLGTDIYDIMMKKVDAHTDSATNWMVVVDKRNHRIAVLRRKTKASAWYFVKKAKCSIGMHTSPENVTLAGKWTVGSKYYETTHYGYTDWYHTNVSPLGITQMEIHSVLYKAYSKTRFVDGRLGKDISNGCVRTTLEMSKYIYDHVPKTSRVYVYD